MLSSRPRNIILFGVLLTLITSVLAARHGLSTDFALRGIDGDKHVEALATIRSAQPGIKVYPAMRLPYYRGREPLLARLIHEEAKRGSILPVGTHRPKHILWWLGIRGKVSNYYAVRIGPNNRLADSLGLNVVDEYSPQGKEAWAFWKHRDGKAKLLAMDTNAFTGAGFSMRQLDSLIPVGAIRSVT